MTFCWMGVAPHRVARFRPAERSTKPRIRIRAAEGSRAAVGARTWVLATSFAPRRMKRRQGMKHLFGRGRRAQSSSPKRSDPPCVQNWAFVVFPLRVNRAQVPHVKPLRDIWDTELPDVKNSEVDVSFQRNPLAFDIYRHLGGWATETAYVNVEWHGDLPEARRRKNAVRWDHTCLFGRETQQRHERQAVDSERAHFLYLEFHERI